MADKRKWTLFIGALMAVGIANFGCSDEDAVFLPEGDLNSAAEDCKSANTCTTADACQSGVGAIACKCVTDNDYCHSDVRCNGVGSCSYVCSPNAGTCSYAGCASDPACSGPGPGPSTCDIDNLSPNEDFDKDGIPNGKELNSRISVNNEIKSLDPCKPDTDGDGIFDGDEDLNHNGIFESWLGETNPVDINDPEDADTEVGRNKSSVKKLVCNSDNLRDSILLKSYRVAKVRNDITYLSDQVGGSSSDVTAFDDKSTNVVTAFIGSTESYDSVNFIHYAFQNYDTGASSEYVLETVNDFNSLDNRIPNSVWLNNKVYARETPTSALDFEHFQVIPDHIVNRHIFTLTVAPGTKLTDVRNELVSNITEGKSAIQSTEVFDECADNKIKLYYAQSRYEDASNSFYVYSVAMACNSSLSSIDTTNMMNDVKSGTLVAGGTKFFSNRDFLCQQEKYGDASGTVDFLWVVDNSGSMADELENLSTTIDLFTEKLSNSGIDYHIGVTTTDSYTIDEWPDGYKAYESVFTNAQDGRGKSNAYLEPTGLINGSGSADQGTKCMFFEGEPIQPFKNRMLSRGCTKNGVQGKNICGYGLEDGIKSGVETLRRLAAVEDGEGYDKKFEFACGSSSKEDCNNINRCMLRDDSLKYVIFVSDEESRQFKESVGISKGVSASFSSHTTTPLQVCNTGYKLSVMDGADLQNILEIVYQMALGVSDALNESNAAEFCNPELKTKDLVNRGTDAITESMSADEIKQKAPEYYHMLMYYIQQYKQFAGSGGVAAFAIVGDIGVEKNGTCPELGEDTSSVNGANYGLSYIHLAKFLGALDADGQFTGKTGGSGCICNTDYTTTVNQIFEDVQGRVASHPLRGYPISSTIRVAVAKSDGNIVELTRGANTNGWRYDESQNAITFNGLTGVTGSDEIAISYVIWSKDEG